MNEYILKRSKCRLCGNDDVHSCFICREHLLLKCDACSYVQIAEKPSQKEIMTIYDTGYFASNKYKDVTILEWENRRRLKILTRFLPSSSTAKVLDAGCATGDFLLAAKTKYRMYGCDISPFAVDIAQKKNPDIADNIFVSNLDSSMMKNSMYDAICLWDVMEHLWDPLSVFEDLVSMLNPSGFLMVSTPDIGSIVARLMGQKWAFMTPPEHMGFFSAKSTRYLFEKALSLRMVYKKVSGKWTNFGFLVYKLGRVFPKYVPKALESIIDRQQISRLPIYIPTHDIQYIVAKKAK